MAARNTKNRKVEAVKHQSTAAEKLLRLMVMVMVVSSIAGMAGWELMSWVNDPETLPVKVVRIDGELKKVKIKKLEEAVASEVTGGYFNINLQAIKATAMQLPWVEDVSVKRIWPDTLVMQITEKTAYARWGGHRLITQSGKIFAPESGIDENLPLLAGRDERAEEVVAVFQRETTRFAKFGLKIKAIELTERGSWVMQFDNDMQVMIGRKDIENRLQRLAGSLSLMKQIEGKPDRVDLRYPHGMAVNWKKSPEEEQSKSNQSERLVANEAV